MKTLILFFSMIIFCTTLYSQQPPLPTLQAGESWTNLYSRSYDYQTNGSIRYIVRDPENPNSFCAMLMAQQDSNGAAGAQRYIYYSYTENNGITWTSDVLETTASWGFPDMSLSNGLPIIAAHRFGSLTKVYKDILFGAFGYTPLTDLPTNIIPSWPHLSGTTNGNIVVAASTNDGVAFGGYFSTFNGSTWSQWSALSQLGGPSGNYSVAAGTNGIVGIFGQDYAGDGAVYYYKSTDNGITFDNGTQIFNYLYDGTDTIFASITGGFQAVYVGNEPHLAFAAYNINASAVFTTPNTLAYVKPKILHWSPSTGVTEVAGKFNIPQLTDTLTTALMPPVTQPSITRTQSGSLICSFTTFIRGNTQVVDDGSVLNAGEIFSCVSSNNGVTWRIPGNLTNTPSIEEKHSSLPEITADDTIKIFYLRDLKAGGWVNIPAWGKAPVYGIFKKIHYGAIGINPISLEAHSYELKQNYPNPFNPSTKIKFSITKSSFTSLIVYDQLGKEVTRLADEDLKSGTYEFEFSAANYGLSSGIYFYKIISGDFADVKKMIMIK